MRLIKRRQAFVLIITLLCSRITSAAMPDAASPQADRLFQQNSYFLSLLARNYATLPLDGSNPGLSEHACKSFNQIIKDVQTGLCRCPEFGNDKKMSCTYSQFFQNIYEHFHYYTTVNAQ